MREKSGSTSSRVPSRVTKLRPSVVSHFGRRMPNDVSIEKELMKAGEIGRNYNLNTSIVKSFQRMMLASVKVTG